MALTPDQSETDLLYRKWIRLGWMATGKSFEDEIDIEELIVETSVGGRQDGRLFKWFLTWLRDYNDLINVKRLLRILDKADTAVLGAALEIAMEQGATANLHTVTKKCKPRARPEVLFTGVEDVFTFIEQEKRHGLPAYKKWGLYCTLLEFYDDARRTREWVLRNNVNLALRALYGPNIRAEIVYCLLRNTNLAVKNVAQRIGYAYSPVYNEIELLIRSGFVARAGFTYSGVGPSKSKAAGATKSNSALLLGSNADRLDNRKGHRSRAKAKWRYDTGSKARGHWHCLNLSEKTVSILNALT